MRFLSVAAVALMLAVPTLASAGDGRITVTGEGRVATAPDMATVSLGVTTEADTAAAALSANNEQLAAVLARLVAAGIAERDVQTTGLSLGPRWDHRPGENQPRVTGYIASNQVTVRVRALDRLGALLDAAVADGANTLNGLSFGVAEPQPLLDDARTRAVADARRKAMLYAAAAGVELGALVSLSEAVEMGGPQPMFRQMADAMAEAVPVAGGEVGLNAVVTLIYEIAE